MWQTLSKNDEILLGLLRTQPPLIYVRPNEALLQAKLVIYSARHRLGNVMFQQKVISSSMFLKQKCEIHKKEKFHH
jgi:hypothetical protein